MTHRERVLTSPKRQQPDRVPVDLGGTLASTINVQTYRRLMKHLGFGGDPPVAFLSRRSNSVLPDERLLRRLDVDCRAVILCNPDLHPERELPDGSLTDEWDITWKHIGEGQHFINAGGPFSGKEPDPALVGAFKWPNPLDAGRFRTLRSQAQTLRGASDAAIILVLGVGAVHQIQFMRGYAAALEDLIAAPDFVQAFLDRYADFWTCMAELALETVGDLVDLTMFGDDLNATDKMKIMHEEIFGPLLPIVPYRDLDDAIRYVNDRPRPLALYYFDKDPARVNKVLRETVSGGVTINDTIFHIAQDSLPFCGVGPSGMGHYHGKEGFDTFSKRKSVFYQTRFNGVGLLKPPYGKMFETMLNTMISRARS